MFLRACYILYHIFPLAGEIILYKTRLITPAGFGRRMARRIEKMGGVFVKVGQLLSVRPDIVSFRVANELRPLLQTLKPVPFKKIATAISKSDNSKLKEYLPYMEAVPLGTGSIAQVHKITRPGLPPLIIKIIKPGLRKYVNADLRMFRFMMRTGSLVPGLNKLPVKELGAELETVIRQQLDMRTEAANLTRFRDNFSGDETVIIPELQEQDISMDFLVTEYIELPTEPGFTDWHPVKRRETARNALIMLYKMMFKDGLTHCDMHPGNFFITPQGKFILLDFGMVARMEGEARQDYIRFFFYMATGNGKACADIIEKTALHKSRRYSREKLEKETIRFINEFSSLSAESFSVVAFTKRLISVERKCGIKGSASFINNILAIVFFESYLKKIDPGIDFQEEAAEYIIRAVPGLPEIFGKV